MFWGAGLTFLEGLRFFRRDCDCFGLRNFRGVENYSVALTNFQGGFEIFRG